MELLSSSQNPPAPALFLSVFYFGFCWCFILPVFVQTFQRNILCVYQVVYLQYLWWDVKTDTKSVNRLCAHDVGDSRSQNNVLIAKQWIIPVADSACFLEERLKKLTTPHHEGAAAGSWSHMYRNVVYTVCGHACRQYTCPYTIFVHVCIAILVIIKLLSCIKNSKFTSTVFLHPHTIVFFFQHTETVWLAHKDFMLLCFVAFYAYLYALFNNFFHLVVRAK